MVVVPDQQVLTEVPGKCFSQDPNKSPLNGGACVRKADILFI